MFNNRFNSSKKDPLIEAVMQARAEGDLRRAAEALVNEEFGVFSRKAVVREQLAAYDAALEEAYKCMKEGEKWEGSKEDKDEDKKLAKKHGMTMKQWEKSEADKKHDKKEKMDEAKKLAKKDYDKDGKIESPKDEVWGSRFRAAKAAGKMEEGSQWRKPGREGRTWGTDSSEDREDGHETKFQLNKKGKISDGPGKDVLAHRKDPDKWYSKTQQKKHGVDLKSQIKNQIGKHTKPNLPEETDYSSPDRAAVTKDNKPVVSSTAPKADTSGPSAADKAGLAAKIGAMKEAKLYELKAPTGKTARQVMDRAERRDDEEGDWTRSNRIYKSMKRRYPGKSARNQKDTGKADLPDVGNIEFHKAGYPGHVTKGGKLTKAASRDTKDGIKSRLGKHTKPHLPEETIEEAVSRKHFQQVADLIKGHESQAKRNELASHHAGIFAKQNPRFSHEKFHAAAGSTAHQTQTVKESVLAAVRAKYMKEDSSFKSARVTESNKLGLGKSVNEVTMGTPPAIVQPAVRPARAAQSQVSKPMTARFGQTGGSPINARPNVTTSSKFAMQRGMSQAGSQAATTRASTLGGMNIADKIGSQAASKVPSVLGAVGRAALKAMGPIGTAASIMEPTPANQGENEFARQAKYAPKTTPGSMNISKQPAPTTGPSAAAAEKVGISQKMPKLASVSPKPDAAPVPPTSTTNKSGYFKGGSMGDRTVKSGETLSGIAKSTGQSVADLAKMNKIDDVNKISAGAKLMTKVPTPPSRPADTASDSTSQSQPFGSASDLAKDVDKAKNTPKSNPTIRNMQESVQIGANKYRIV